METHLKVQGLNVYYQDVHALHDVHLEIPRRKITVILGPSGCGKTTLLKSFNRFLELEDGVRLSGQVLLDGVDIYSPQVDVQLIRKRAGLLAQRPFPLPMSIFDNVAYGLRLHNLHGLGRRVNRRELERAVQHYLEMAGLWAEVQDRLHAPATALSIGQQQRLCLARGLAVEPELLLGDEPTSALDPLSAQYIENRLHELKTEYTVVLVTHVLRQARRLADYVVFMWLGQVVEAGPAEEVFNHPREEGTRAYLAGEL